MSKIERLIAETKFLFAKNFYSQIDNFAKIKADKNDEIYKFLTVTRGTKELKAFIILDAHRNEQRILEMLKFFCKSNKKLNDTMLSSIASSLINSYCTVIEVLSVDEDYCVIYDKLLNKSFKVESASNLSDRELLFARLIEIDGYYYVISILEVLDESFELLFTSKIYNIFKAYAEERNLKSLSDENKIEILKIYLADIFLIFASSTSEFMELQNTELSEKDRTLAINTFFNNEDSKIFERFLLYANSKLEYEEEMCIYFFNIVYIECLAPIGKNFSDFENYNFIDIFENATKNGFIYTNSEFKNTITLLKYYYEFALKTSNKFLKPYEELKYILKYIFLYQNNLSKSFNGFYFDENLFELIPNNFECTLLKNYITFTDLFNDLKLQISENKNMLTNASVNKLATALNLKTSREIKTPNQTHYPLINFFYNFSVTKSILKNENGDFDFSERLMQFLSLDGEEQYAIFIETIFNRDFLLTYLNEKKVNIIFDNLKIIFETLYHKDNIETSDLNIDNEYSYLLDILQRLDIISISNTKVTITNNGKAILNYFSKIL